MNRILSLASRLIERAFNEEEFRSWPLAEQKKWIKDHPNSKFAKEPLKRATKKPTTENKDDKKAKAAEAFQKMLETKSESDRKAFLLAKSHGISIPPAWTNVTYNVKPVNGVVAEGTDAKGRKQRLEDPDYRQGKIREKHERIQANLEPKFDKIVKYLRKNLDTPENQCLYLITQTAFRIGGEGDGKARAKAYGASTLLGKHVTVNGNEVTFDFIGKEGVRQVHKVRDPMIAKFVSGKGPEERLFNVSDAKIRDAWKKLGGEKVHDIRSLIATRIARNVLGDLIPPPPQNQKEFQKILKTVSEVVSAKLGNRPSEALNTYIDQRIFEHIAPKETTT